jgi:hypothetical protein
MNRKNDSFAIVGLLFILFLAFNLFRSREDAQAASPQEKEADQLFSLEEQSVITVPYDQYKLTQGPHGYSYGHQALDLSAGNGSVIRSPINGFVTDLYIDEVNNPTLIIENDLYQVTLLHGKYSVKPGQRLLLGQPIGIESNLGYTKDMSGRPCVNRDCGYHTHLNIYDKRLGENANPLVLLGLE